MSLKPRGLPTKQAAAYIGTSEPVFRKVAADHGLRPLFPGRREKVYDRLQLDALLDRLGGRVNDDSSMADREAEAEALRRLDERSHALRH